MSRKLASVQTVKAIKPIEGALDRIEIVQILNWNCVASKGQSKVVSNKYLLKGGE